MISMYLVHYQPIVTGLQFLMSLEGQDIHKEKKKDMKKV